MIITAQIIISAMQEKNDMEYSNDGDLRLIDCRGSTYSEEVDINIDL